MEATLLQDTMEMPSYGGLPYDSIDWLQKCFRKHPEYLETVEEMAAYHRARFYGVNFIAVCEHFSLWHGAHAVGWQYALRIYRASLTTFWYT